jgi:hypothetical protein
MHDRDCERREAFYLRPSDIVQSTARANHNVCLVDEGFFRFEPLHGDLPFGPLASMLGL